MEIVNFPLLLLLPLIVGILKLLVSCSTRVYLNGRVTHVWMTSSDDVSADPCLCVHVSPRRPWSRAEPDGRIMESRNEHVINSRRNDRHSWVSHLTSSSHNWYEFAVRDCKIAVRRRRHFDETVANEDASRLEAIDMKVYIKVRPIMSCTRTDIIDPSNRHRN